MLKQCTIVGENHFWGEHSRIQLQWGSLPLDIVLKDHCEVFGSLVSIHHGKIIMDEWSKIGEGSIIYSVNKVVIGKDTAIASGVTIVDNNFHPINPEDRRFMRHTPHNSQERSPVYSSSAPIFIGQNVLIGSNSRICKGVTIGDNAIVGACAVVTKDVPANSIVVGNPARVVKQNIDLETKPLFPLTNPFFNE